MTAAILRLNSGMPHPSSIARADLALDEAYSLRMDRRALEDDMAAQRELLRARILDSATLRERLRVQRNLRVGGKL